MMSIEQIIEKMAVAHHIAGTRWVRIEEIAKAAGLSTEEIAAGVQELMTEESFRAEAQPFGNRITEWDRANAPVIGGEARHLISWE
jgi:hypothetical protein